MATTTYTRLPHWVKPIHYNLSLFDLTCEEPWTYQGCVEIALSLQRQIRQITMHARYLTVHSARVSTPGGQEVVEAIDISYDARYQRCTLSFERDIQATPDSSVVLSIDFEGTISDDLVGFYRSTYKCGPEQHFMFSTQFQPCEARRAFPCFDEPDSKATFDFEIETPANMVALSNMPIRWRRTAGKNRTITAFHQTPIMSSYLLAWAVGEFEYLEAPVVQPSGRALPLRLYSTPGLTSRGHFALELAQKIVPFFTEKFGVEYPLPKLDLLAVHDTADDMENWGLITFQLPCLLFDNETSDPSFRYEVAYTVAHEIAHQWFGNLVTMEWWDDLWLNEAFATWAGIFATDHFFPQWNVWAKFVSENLQDAFELDALTSSHPIHVPVLDDLEVDSIFDAISYDKGCAVLRMLVPYLGLEGFLQGVRNYLVKHSYRNTKARDLWEALSQVSGEDVIPFVTPWVEQIGFPAVTFEENHAETAVRLRQRPFSSAVMQDADVNGKSWWIPLTLAPDDKKLSTKLFLKTSELDLQKSVALHDLPNVDYAGFFRTSFSPRQVDSLSHNLGRLSVTERAGLVDDVLALAMADNSMVNSVTLLQLIRNFRREDNYYPWSAVLSSVDLIQSMFSHNAQIRKGLDGFVIKLVSSAAERLGWPESQSSLNASIDYLPDQTRSMLLLALGMAGDFNTTTKLTSQFRAFFAGDRTAIPVSLQPAAFQVAIKELGSKAYEMLKVEYLCTNSIGGTETILRAMGSGLKADLFHSFINFVFSKEVTIQNVVVAARALAGNSDIQIRELLWTFIQANWDLVVSRIGGANVIFERFIQGSLETIASGDTCTAIEDFFQQKDTTGYSQGLAIAIEKIRANVRWIGRDSKDLELYFSYIDR